MPHPFPLVLLSCCLLGTASGFEIQCPGFGLTAEVDGPWIVTQRGKPVDAERIVVRDAGTSVMAMRTGKAQSISVEVDAIAEHVADTQGLVGLLKRKFDNQQLQLKVTGLTVVGKDLQGATRLAMRYEALGPEEVFERSAPNVPPLGDVLYIENGDRYLLVVAHAVSKVGDDGNEAPPVYPDADRETKGLFPVTVAKPAK